MRPWLVVLALVVLVNACGNYSIRMTGVNYETKRFSVCGNNYTQYDELNEFAGKSCPAGFSAKPLSCGQSQDGAIATAAGDIAVGGPRYGVCCVYTCSKPD